MMRSNKRIIISLGIVFVLLVIVSYFLLPVALELYTEQIAYETRQAISNDYKLHTTPLSEHVVIDLCVKLKLKNTSEHCKAGVVVYAPELFDELKTYFHNLPDQNKTYETVQDTLGSYLVSCSSPEPDGYFRCRYDLKGDSVYPIYFDFDNNGFYWQIIANIGGS